VPEGVSGGEGVTILDPVGVGTPEVNGTSDDPVAEGKAGTWVEEPASG